MTDFLRSRRYGECLIILNNGHTALSPGGVSGGRTEYGECARLINAVSKCLEGLPVKITEGTKGYSDEGLLFVFHKGTSEKNKKNGGAEIFVSADACARTQYNAYRMLTAFCGENGYRYRGVHTLTEKSPFRCLFTSDNEDAYLIKAGYIDCPADSKVPDRPSESAVCALSREIMRIYKEKINEDYS